eukprot:TRINITY_DN1517_c0_g1_i1.p1 TRINITY_DN1517_c0_g1~~TRINITY_DN1517_c0_g1_i1.p1  ORF type:complete len:1000 (-),score=289.72 TRINITY_DN1517_c0_g1_i1:35-3034(-)
MPRKKPTTPPPIPPPAQTTSSHHKKDASTTSERTGLKLVLRKDKNESSWSVATPTAATTTTTTTTPTTSATTHSTKSKNKEKHKHKHHKDKTKHKEKEKKKDDDRIPPIYIPKITIKTSDMVLNRELTTPLVTTKSAPALSTAKNDKEQKARRNSFEGTTKSSSGGEEKKKRRKSDISDSSTPRIGVVASKSRTDKEERETRESPMKEARKKKESPKKGAKPKETAEEIARRVASVKKIGSIVLAKLIKQDKYGIFYEPVSEKDVPDYYQIIKNPMDFSTLRSNLNNGDYGTLEAFEADLLRIFQNAMIYNRPGTIYFDQAKSFQSMASQLLDANRTKIESQPTPSTPKIPTTPTPTQAPTSTTTTSTLITPYTPTVPNPSTPSTSSLEKKKKKKKKKQKEGRTKEDSKNDEKKRRKSDEKISKRRKSLDVGDEKPTHQAAVPPPPLPPPPILQSPHVELPGGFSDLVDGQPPVKKRGRPLGSKNKGPRRRPGEEGADGDSSKRRKVKRDSATADQILPSDTAVDMSSTLESKKENHTDIQAISSPTQLKPLASAAKVSTPIPTSLPPKATATPSPSTPLAKQQQRPAVTSPSTAKPTTPTPAKPRKVYVPNSVVSPTTATTTTKPTTKPATPAAVNSPSYNMYISKRAATNGTTGTMLHSSIGNSQTNNYINTSKPKAPVATQISSFSTEKAYRASLEAFVKSLGKSALDQVAKFISSMRTTPVVIQSQAPPLPPPPPQQNRITLSPEILGDMKSITDDSIDIDALQEILSLRNDGLEIVDTIAAKILEEDTYRFLRKMQEEYAMNSEESIELDENACKVQEILDNNFEMLCALQMQQYQRLNSSPNDTEVKLVSQLSENLKQLTRQVEPGILVDLQTIQAKLNTFRKRMSFAPNASTVPVSSEKETRSTTTTGVEAVQQKSRNNEDGTSSKSGELSHNGAVTKSSELPTIAMADIKNGPTSDDKMEVVDSSQENNAVTTNGSISHGGLAVESNGGET